MSRIADGLRQALRLHGRAPGFTAMAVLTLALGVGATTTVFSVVRGVLLRPLPLLDPERLVMITRDGDVSLPDGIDWRAESKSFESIALFLRAWAFDLSGSGEPERLSGVVAEAEYFRVLGVSPLLGRVFDAGDDRLGGPQVALISEGLWKRRFAGDPQVIGQKLTLSDQVTTIIGVMPAAFDFMHDRADLWLPASVAVPWAVPERGTNNFDAIGRLRPGVEVAAARSEMIGISERLAEAYPKTNKGKIVEPIGLADFMVGDVRKGLWLLLGAVSLVVLIVSVNLASLLLARSVGRQEEFAVRASLGADRGRILRQLLAEGLTLALAGGLLGALLAWLGTTALVRALPPGLPRAAEIEVDAAVLAFSLLAAVTAGLVFSLVPALHVVRGDLVGLLRGGARGATAAGRQRLLSSLVVTEVAIAVMLLVGAGLLLRTFAQLQQAPLGFTSEHVLCANLILPESRYASQEPQSRAFSQIIERLAALPGVSTAAYVTTPPLEPRGGIGGRMLIEDRPVEKGSEPGVRWRPVHGDYFQALRIPIVAGRAFDETDGATTAPVAIVNESFAREFWPGQDPLGKRISWRDFPQPAPRWMTVVGVAKDIKSRSLADSDVRAVYSPYLQRDPYWIRFGTLVVRTRAEPQQFARSLREAVWAVDPTLPLDRVEPLDTRVRDALAPQRASALALAVFAAGALLLSLQGIYGVLAYAVEQRRREIGVRMALGARAPDLVALVVRRGLGLTTIGLLAGLGAAIGASRLLGDLLYGVTPLDPVTFGAVALCVLAAALIACFLPAWRAARTSPLEALRCQ